MGYGSYEVLCDCPPMPIVEACKAISDLEKPLDVRWNRFAVCKVCRCCGRTIQPKRWYFYKGTKDEVLFEIGQCEHCKTIMWKQG